MATTLSGTAAVAIPSHRGGEHRPGHRFPAVLLGISVAGTLLLSRRIGPGFAVADPVLASVVAVGGLRLLQSRSTASSLAVRCLPGFWLVLVASLVSLFGVGLAGWATLTLLQDLFAFALFFCSFQLAFDAGRYLGYVRTVAYLTVAALCLTLVLAGNDYRSAGTFANPNYAGHFVAIGTLLALSTSKRSAAGAALLVLAAVALLRTGSFASMGMLAAGIMFFLWQRMRTHTQVGYRVLFAGLLVAGLGFGWSGLQRLESERVDLSEGVSSERFERSSSLRFEIWGSGLSLLDDHPLGVGPYGVPSRNLIGRGAELHSDYLAYLIERGVVGLAGLVLVMVTLWRRSPPGGHGRLLLVAVVVGAIFRETLHFRHLWLFLGLAFAFDHLAHASPARRRAVQVGR